jgi:hypothetical protein
MRKLTLFIYLVTQIFLVNNSNAQTNTITSFDEFMNLANAKSMTIKSGEIQLTQSKKAKIAAIYGVIDPSGSLSGSYTNNTQLDRSIQWNLLDPPLIAQSSSSSSSSSSSTSSSLIPDGRTLVA